MTGLQASYTWQIDGDYLVIIDQDGPVSVTNDVEAVIADLVEEGVNVDSKRVLYRDSEGLWDQILTTEGRFHDFRILTARSLEEAKAKWSRP